MTGPGGLAAVHLHVTGGVDLVDEQDRPIEDLTGDVLESSTAQDVHDEVPGSCDLTLMRDLAWGVDKVRPWVAVNGVRQNLGVYYLTSPDREAGEPRRAQGYDKLWLLRRESGDTYVIPAGTSYLDAIRGVLSDAGVTGRLHLQGDRQATVLEEPGVWVLGGRHTWLHIINDLLGMIGYDSLWADGNGTFRSSPYQALEDRAPRFHLDTGDPWTTVDEHRRLTGEVRDRPNQWRFVRKKDRALTEDDVYVVDHSEGLPAWQVRPKTEYVDAADRDALVAEGDRIVAEDSQAVRTVTLTTTPLPLVHGDVVTVTDAELGLSRARGLAASWRLDLSEMGATMHLTVELL